MNSKGQRSKFKVTVTMLRREMCHNLHRNFKHDRSMYGVERFQSRRWSTKAAFTPRQHVPGNMLLVAGQHMLPVSRRHNYYSFVKVDFVGLSLCIQQQTSDKLATILLTATSNMLPGNMLPWCKRGIIAAFR